jgi:hypothetical protein
MMRPMCPACRQRACAINYYKDDEPHWRTRCDTCIAKGRREKIPESRWKTSGYKKKTICDRCAFRAKYSAQLVVFHVDGDLNNSELRNLKTICLNCVEEIKRSSLPWRPGDLEPDL